MLSVEQAAAERGQAVGQVVRSIVFRLGAGSYCMVLAGGGRQVDWPTLRRYLGQSRLSLASEAEVLQVTGAPLGAVSPLGTPTPLRTLIDNSALAYPEISIGSGLRGTTVILQTAALLAALPACELGDFSRPDEPPLQG